MYQGYIPKKRTEGLLMKLLQKNKIKMNNLNSELCHHRPRSKAHSNEYDNNADKAEQSLPAWCGGGMSINNAMLLLCFASGLPYGFRDRHRLELVPKITTKMCKLNSQQSSDRSCFYTNTRTHTRQNKPYRLGAVPAGVVGARGRCCPAATVPVAVAFACGVCCCIADKIQNKKSSTEKESFACHA